MIVPSAAGGATDVVARILAERMRRLLEKPVIIENVSGANGSIGAGRVARAAPDGYTIIIGIVTTHVLNGALYSLQYDVMNAFAPIALLASTPLILFARSTMQANNLNELLLWLKANSNNASMGFGGTGSYLLSALFQKEIATHLTLVPYRGGNLATQDLVAGQIDLQFNSLDQLPLARASKIKAYLVTSDTRLATAPDIPTAAEMGLPALSYSQWTGLFAPRGTPEGVISKLNGAAADALADSAVQSGLGQLGMEIFPRDQQTPEALSAKQRADAAKWLPLIKEFGIKAE
jgi:tripartite-type tricarboxylate transporter receptor subunit TctC